MTSLQKLMRVLEKAEFDYCMYHLVRTCKDELFQISFLQEHYANERYDTMRALVIAAMRDVHLDDMRRDDFEMWRLINS